MKYILIVITGICLLAETVWAMTPLELKGMLDQNKDITLIDIRSKPVYRDGHIQGAINIPASVLAMKRLPGIGSVIVYGDGIRTGLTARAAAMLDSREGIRAEPLQGGYAAWESLNLTTTRKKGIAKRPVPTVTYRELKEMAAEDADIVLLDLRSQSKSRTDLSAPFPGLDAIRLKEKASARTTAGNRAASMSVKNNQPDTAPAPLYILVDDGNGESEKAARRLMASGKGRVAILTGGELSLKRKGLPGRMVKETKATVKENKQDHDG